MNQKQEKKWKGLELELELNRNSHYPKFQNSSAIALETSKAEINQTTKKARANTRATL